MEMGHHQYMTLLIKHKIPSLLHLYLTSSFFSLSSSALPKLHIPGNEVFVIIIFALSGYIPLSHLGKIQVEMGKVSLEVHACRDEGAGGQTQHLHPITGHYWQLHHQLGVECTVCPLCL
ncbi:hypothetical protein E2C01_037816 [Portunus trituberculatus]|uniref:Uncharacterized protein n=1 Tax=Portunus trituberculatus TaxID=210409 RepID=A0A5B7FCH1_PORTR|nr:hypothetical protein [Portunus trituberculatus]